MKTHQIFPLIVGLVVIPILCVAEEADPEKWYTQHYAPLWSDDPAAKIGEIAQFYDESIVTYSDSGETTATNSRGWLESAFKYWIADDWIDSELVKVRVDRLNDSTVVFKAQWLDRYENREDERSCGWYLANRRDGRWAFTSYTELDCSEHGF